MKRLKLGKLPNPFEQEVDIEKLASLFATSHCNNRVNTHTTQFQIEQIWINGYKAAQSKQFSLEDIIAFGKKCFYKGFDKSKNDDANSFTAWREEYPKLIQSLSTQKLPKEFIPEYEEIEVDRYVPKMTIDKLKTTTNSEGKEELVGTYKY